MRWRARDGWQCDHWCVALKRHRSASTGRRGTATTGGGAGIPKGVSGSPRTLELLAIGTHAVPSSRPGSEHVIHDLIAGSQ